MYYVSLAGFVAFEMGLFANLVNHTRVDCNNNTESFD